MRIRSEVKRGRSVLAGKSGENGPAITRFVVIFAALAVGLSVIRTSTGSESASVAVAAICIVLASATIGVSSRAVGYFSIGGAISILSVAAFWLKWIFRTTVAQGLRPNFADNSRALVVYAIFLLPFTLTWVYMIRSRAENRVPRDFGLRKQEALSGNPFITSLLGLLAGLLLAGRVYLADQYQIGVPGVAPLVSSGGTHIYGFAYYVSAYGPLLVAAVLLITRHRSAPRLWLAVAALAAYAAVGANLGYRSYGMSAALVLLYCLAGTRSVTGGQTQGLSIRRLLMGVLILVATLLAVGSALKTRPSAGEPNGSTAVVGFLVNRIGGLNYLAPAVGEVDADPDQPSFRNISPSTWDEYVKVDVYGFPPSATNGLAATLPGWLYGIGGMPSVGLLAAAFGILAGAADVRKLRSKDYDRVSSTLLHLGVFISTLNLYLEGTPGATLDMMLLFVVVWFSARFLEARSRDRTRIDAPPVGKGRMLGIAR